MLQCYKYLVNKPMPKRNQLKDKIEGERKRWPVATTWTCATSQRLASLIKQTDWRTDRQAKRQCTDDDDDNEKQAIKHKLTAKNESGEIYLASFASRLFLFLSIRLQLRVLLGKWATNDRRTDILTSMRRLDTNSWRKSKTETETRRESATFVAQRTRLKTRTKRARSLKARLITPTGLGRLGPGCDRLRPDLPIPSGTRHFF